MAEYIEKWPVINRLIDLENEFQQYKPFHGFEHAMYRKICEAEIAIGKTQATDIAPVRHGEWQYGDYYDIGDVCSECDWDSEMTHPSYRYCPNCGAKMVGGED